MQLNETIQQTIIEPSWCIISRGYVALLYGVVLLTIDGTLKWDPVRIFGKARQGYLLSFVMSKLFAYIA